MAKSKPIGVRFDLDKLEMIQKEQNLTSMQSVLDYLMDFYFKNTKSDITELDKIKVKRNADAPKSEVSYKLEQIPIETKKTPQNSLKMPLGLTASQQIEWKIENNS
jgi:hypothetical protein